MTNSFTNIFGGTTIYPSEIGLINLTITQNTTLVWPDLGETQSAVAASFIRASATAPGLDITLPDADKASVGKALRFKNIGSDPFYIKSASGSTILTNSSGQDWLLSITDNTTSGGTWDVSQIGSGTTSANAYALAGNGLTVSGSQLTVGYPVVTFSSTPYAIPLSGRADLYIWEGGNGTVTFPTPTSGDNGFLILLKNGGSGVLTVSALIDNGVFGSNLTLQPGGQGALFDWDGSQWRSYGYVNLTTLNLNSTYTKTLTSTSVSLTTTEAQNNIISFAGTLAGDTVVNFPNFTYIYDITNSTNGAFSLTVQPSNGNGVVIPQANTRLVTNNASVMYFSDSISGTTVLAATGLTSTTSGSIETIYIANTTVTSGAYGDNHNYSIFTVNPQGQMTSALAIPFSGLTFTSITLTGPTTAPTVTAGNSSTSVATTEFAMSMTGNGMVNPTVTGGTFRSSTFSGGSFSGGTFTSPALVGTPTAPTATNATSGTQVATTAFAYGTFSTASNTVTFPNGFTMKYGTTSNALSTVPTTVSFTGAFATSCVAVGLTLRATTDLSNINAGYYTVSSRSTTSFVTVYRASWDWVAYGY